MLSAYLFCWLLLTRFICIRTEFCSKAEIQRARESHHTCLSRMKDKLFQHLIVFQQSTNFIKSEDELCQIINETAFGCDQGYENCLNQNEIRAMRQTQRKIRSELLTLVSKVIPQGKMTIKCQELKDFKTGNENECAKSTTHEYHTCIDHIHAILIKRITHKSAKHLSIKEINGMICDGMNDVIVYCSAILAHCMEPMALIEMQNVQWNILRTVMNKKEAFANFQCEQELASFGTSANPTNLIFGFLTVLLIVLF